MVSTSICINISTGIDIFYPPIIVLSIIFMYGFDCYIFHCYKFSVSYFSVPHCLFYIQCSPQVKAETIIKG